eukprot:COSAG05_NODE_1481_length_4761_cov_4.755684_4_plen_470_part_00
MMKSCGQAVSEDTHIIFVFVLLVGAIVLRDLQVESAYILWLGVGAAALFENRELKSIVRKLLFTSVSVFFREVQSVGTEKLPRDGPLILVCAPHSNQFVDPAVVLHLLPTDFYTRSRRIGFLVAAKSWRRRVVGLFARVMDGVPVERPQDIARRGTGTLIVDAGDPHHLHGNGTLFSIESKAGDAVVFKLPVDGLMRTYSFAVVSVISDTRIRIKPGRDQDMMLPLGLRVEGLSFKCQPRVTQSRVFKYCHDALGRGDCIGIFPEGGSHDRSHLIPIKSGVSVIALGAMARHHDVRVRIVPVGMNYFQGHRFRSRAFVEFGDPMDIPSELVAEYCAGLPQPGSGCLILTVQPKIQLVGATTSELSVGDTICITLGDSPGIEKRAVVERVLSDHEATLTTALVDASEIEQLGETITVPYTVTSALGKSRQHEACDRLLQDIKKGLQAASCYLLPYLRDAKLCTDVHRYCR